MAELVAEGATPVVLGMTAWWFGATWALLAFGYLAVIAIVLTAIDLAEHRLPDRIVLPSYWVAAGLLAVASAAAGDWTGMARAGLGLVAMGGFYFLLAMINPAGLGFGDVKLAGLLGAYLGWLGWPEVVIGAIGGFVLGGVLSLVLVAVRLADRKTPIPFGPFMLLGAAFAVVAGQPVAHWYLG